MSKPELDEYFDRLAVVMAKMTPTINVHVHTGDTQRKKRTGSEPSESEAVETKSRDIPTPGGTPRPWVS